MYNHMLNNRIVRNCVRWLMHGECEFYESISIITSEPNIHDEMEEMLKMHSECQCQIMNLKEVFMFMRRLQT